MSTPLKEATQAIEQVIGFLEEFIAECEQHLEYSDILVERPKHYGVNKVVRPTRPFNRERTLKSFKRRG